MERPTGLSGRSRRFSTQPCSRTRPANRLSAKLRAEIESADAIDVVMAFIRWSGVRPLLDALRRHCEAASALRVLTTTYTNCTEQRALDELVELGAEVRISYDMSTTRLHAKAGCSTAISGFSTAYVGSSNLTHSAQVTGLEWNVRVSGVRNPDVVAKFAAVFEQLLGGRRLRPLRPRRVRDERHGGRRTGPHVMLSPIEIELRPFQERLLELIELARHQGHHRNLLVAATGPARQSWRRSTTRGLRRALPRCRLLFVAHREEILDQSLATFRYALRDAAFGEKWVGGHAPDTVRACLRIDPEPERLRASRTSTRSTSTWSSSTSSITLRRRRTRRCSNT